jgi:hypothetical protein
MANSDDFIVWATNPKLNTEEAFCAEVIVEKASEIWRHKNKVADPENWEAKRERHKKRALNPAHRSKLNLSDVEGTASILDDVHHFWVHASKHAHDDRPLRNISGLRFLRNLKDVNLHGTEISDVSVLKELRQLQKLGIWDDELDDVTPLAQCFQLQAISLRLSQPWPQFAPLEGLTELKHFEWSGNPLVMETLSALPSVRKVKFEGGFNWKLPLRDLHRLPAMLMLHVLELDPAWSIEGIERWPTITNLALTGNVRDLRPLQRLSHLTHLTLKTDKLRNVQHLVGIPELHHLIVDSDHPVDFSSLTDAPRLHEIEIRRCEINQMEVATLNSVLPSWDEEFAASSPRVLKPLGLKFVPDLEVFKDKNPGAATIGETENNPGMLASEARWVKRRVQSRLKKFLGSDQWGLVEVTEQGYRGGSVEINSLESAEQLSKIIETIRLFLAQTRFQWEFAIRIALKSEWHQKHPELEKELQQQRLIEEHLDFEARQKERADFLERQHRAELLQQEGMKVKPEDFAAPEDASEITGEETDFSTSLQMPDEPEPHPLAEQLDCMARLTETDLIVGAKQRAAIEHFLGQS